MLVAMRTAVAIGALIAAGAVPMAGAARANDSAVPKTTVTAPPGTPSWLMSDAWHQASLFGDPAPSSITVLLGTNYKLVLRGHFVCGNSCFFAPGATPPRGEVLVIWVEGHSQLVSGLALYTVAQYGHSRIVLAQLSNRLFSIFPSQIGTTPCSIVQADASQPKLAATCSTQVEEFRDGRARVTFQETWRAGGSLTHTWIVVVSAQGTAGPATSSGDQAPQLAPGQKTSLSHVAGDAGFPSG